MKRPAKKTILAALTIAAFASVSVFALAQTTQTAPAPAPATQPANPAPSGTAPAPAGTPPTTPEATEAAPNQPSPNSTPLPPSEATGNTPAPTPGPVTAQPSSEGAASPAPGSAPAPSPAAQATPGPASSSEAVGQENVPPPDTTALEPKDVEFSFQGPFGTYDRASLQRGFQVYKEVCSACHSLKRVAFHNLGDPGGPGFSAAQVKGIAAGFQVPADPDEQGKTFNDSGERITRPGTPADYFPWKYENDKAARAANNGALPPDLSVIIKAREGGPQYVYSILTGFGRKPPANEVMADNMNYNPFFAGHQIAMPAPLSDGVVTYSDGTKATVDQMAHDVATFLSWAAEPKMEERKRMGFGVMLFLFLTTGLLYLAYHKLWHGKHDVDVG